LTFWSASSYPGARAVAEEVGQRQEALLCRRLLGKSRLRGGAALAEREDILSRGALRRAAARRLGRLGAQQRCLAISVEESVDERAAWVARCGVDHQPRILIDGHHVLVLVDDPERQVLRHKLRTSAIGA